MICKMFSLTRKKLALASLLFMICSLILPGLTVKAADNYPKIIDQAMLLTYSQTEELTKVLDQLSQKHKSDVTIVTLNSINGMDSEDAAWSVYQEAGFGQGQNADGVILLISMEERDWAIVASGASQEAFNEDAREHIADVILSNLSAGNYYDAFAEYGNLCDEMFTLAEEGKPYKKPFALGFSLLISLITGLIGGGGTVGAMKGNLKSVHRKTAAGQYISKNSFELTESRDRFLYRTVTRRARPKDNNSGRGGGSSHSGSHGKF
ncbi:MAG: TPM domain-containing protein [Dorea sp.]|nr:TPM domain-containing protein [Dorea sp.]